MMVPGVPGRCMVVYEGGSEGRAESALGGMPLRQWMSIAWDVECVKGSDRVQPVEGPGDRGKTRKRAVAPPRLRRSMEDPGECARRSNGLRRVAVVGRPEPDDMV